MADCWNCPKQNELKSLRAPVKRFESEKEYQKLRQQAEDDRNRRIKAEEEKKFIRSQFMELRLRTETSERELQKAKRELEKLEVQLKSRDRALTEQKDIIRQKDRIIGELKKEKEELLQPFRDAIEEMRDNRDKSKDQEHSVEESNQEETDSIPEEVMELMKEIVDLRGNLQAKEAQLRNNSTNCSIPSSLCLDRSTPNNREKSDRNPGGQPGHKGHGRKWLDPNMKVTLGVPEEVLKDPDLYYKTGEKKIKQIHSVRLIVEAVQYEAIVYRNRSTRKRVWARFPRGIVNDITYDASVKALACILHSHGNMSYEKVQEVISELTDGKLKPSTGFLTGLEREFSDKTSIDRKHIWLARQKSLKFLDVPS